MTLVLVAMFVAAGVGLFAREFGAREYRIAAAIAILLTLAYFLRPSFMT